jgi:hypothetical protein
MRRALGANDVLESGEGLLEDVTIEKEERRERLILCRSGDAAVGRQMREEGVDLPLAHLRRMPLAVEEHEAPHPRGVGLLGSKAVVAHADRVAETVEQPRPAIRVYSSR